LLMRFGPALDPSALTADPPALGKPPGGAMFTPVLARAGAAAGGGGAAGCPAGAAGAGAGGGGPGTETGCGGARGAAGAVGGGGTYTGGAARSFFRRSFSRRRAWRNREELG